MSFAAINMPRGKQTIGGQTTYWSGLPDRAQIERKYTKIALTVGSMALGLSAMASSLIPIPGLGAITSTPMLAISHVIDRMKNSITATDENTYRAHYYTREIRATLDRVGIKRSKGKHATVDELQEAAKYNNALAKIYAAPIKAQKDENRSSFLMNSGVAAVGLIPGGGLLGAGNVMNNATEVAKFAKEGVSVAKMVAKAKAALPAAVMVGRDIAGGMAGGAIASALAKDTPDPQELSEAITAAVMDAQSKGVSVNEVLSPKLIFTLRVAQDAALGKFIKETAGKEFHKLDEAKQLEVMAQNKALMDSAEMDVVQIAGIKDPVQQADAVRGLGATEANLDPARKYAVGTPQVGFVGREMARRAAANDARIPESTVRAVGGHTVRLQAERQRMATLAQAGRQA